MHYSAQTISASTSDTTPSLLLNFDGGAKYLFNCGEGTQRALSQLKVGTKGLKSIFATELGSDAVGGLSGMMFTVSDRHSTPVLNLIGPENLGWHVATMRAFFQRTTLAANFIERPVSSTFADSTPIFKDDFITVYSVALSQEDTSARMNGSSGLKRKRSGSPSADESASSAWVDPARATKYNLGYMFARDLPKAFSNPSQLPLADLPPHPLDVQAPGDIGLSSSSYPGRSSSSLLVPANFTRFTEMPSPTNPHRAHLCYIVVGPEKRGKFLVEKAEALGVPKSERSALILDGKIEVADASVEGGKRTILSEECLGTGTPSSVTLVIDCPTVDLVDQLASRPIWDSYRSPVDGIHPVHIIWHRHGTWPESERYQAWMSSFGPNVVHLSGDARLLGNPSPFRGAASAAAKLSLIDPSVFGRHIESAQLREASSSSIHTLQPGQTISVLPRSTAPIAYQNTDPKVIEAATLASMSTEALEAHVAGELPKFLKIAKQARVAVQIESDARAQAEKSPGDDIVVTALGTGSSLPSKYRNVSSTLLAVPGFGDILLDCGEGSLGQLSRRFGVDQLDAVLAGIKLIFISHLHADHHSGLCRILRRRSQVVDPSNVLYLACPDRVITQVRESQLIEDNGLASGLVKFIDNGVLLPGTDRPNAREAAKATIAEALEATGLATLETCLVDHRGKHCYGGIFVHRDGSKIVYSGDTMPCDTLVEAGKNATLLIHEATIQDDDPAEVARVHALRKFCRDNDMSPPTDGKLYEEIARDKGHSTFAQAIDIGRRMRVKNVLLTHFSQRYPKAAPLKVRPASSSADEQAVASVQNIGLALDLMSIPIGQMWKLARYQDAVAALFDEMGDEADDDEPAEGSVVKAGGSVQGGKGGKNKGGGGGGGAKKDKGGLEGWKEKQAGKEKAKSSKGPRAKTQAVRADDAMVP